MLIRQKIVLALLDQMSDKTSNGDHEEVPRINLVKWAFLFGEETKTKAFYEFLPYRHGPFSFTLYHELKKLEQNGYIRFESSEGGIQRISDVPAPPLTSALRDKVGEFSMRFRHFTTQNLVKRVYSSHPWFTINAEKLESRQEERPTGKPAVYTAGYEGLHIDGFLNGLIEAGIKRIIDVRDNPVSRRYGFHKSTLSGVCRNLNLQYEHVPEAGVPSKSRVNLRQPSDYAKFFQDYENRILRDQQDAVKKIAGWIESQPSVLVCMEADPGLCHRSRLAKQIADHTGLPIVNI